MLHLDQRELEQNLQEQLAAINPTLLDRYPLQDYLDQMDQYPSEQDYAYRNSVVTNRCEQIIREGGENALDLYHRLILARLLALIPAKLERRRWPDEVKALACRQWDRIRHELCTTPPGFYHYRNDSFCKDLGLCRLKLIPVGAVLAEDGTAISRRIVLKKGLAQFLYGSFYIQWILGGHKPIYIFHTDSRNLAEFNPEGWEKTFLRLADLLSANTHIKGICFPSSWFLDPKLEPISPRLTYLRHYLEQNHGILLYLGPSEHSTKDALLKSPTRRRLYQEGKYQPVRYMGLWPRKPLIRWAEQTRKSTAMNEQVV